MKIAIDAREACGGEKTGKGWYTYWLLKHFFEIVAAESRVGDSGAGDYSGRDVQFLLFGKEENPPFELPGGVEWVQLPGKSLLWHRAAYKRALAENVDAYFSPTSFIVPALLPQRVRSVVVVHDLIAFLFPEDNSWKATLVEQAVLRRALRGAMHSGGHIITVSEHTKRDLVKHFAIPNDKITVISPGPIIASFATDTDKNAYSNTGHLTSLKPSVIATEKNPYFLAVGTISPRKNYARLALAFAKVREKHPQLELRIVGKEGWKTREIMQTLRTTPGVILHGYASPEELRSLYTGALALVFPSVYEGFGMPALEAMELGCPVVCSNTGALPEVCGNAALQFDPTNIDEIASKLDEIISYNTLRDDLIKKGREQAKKFSWQLSAETLRKILLPEPEINRPK